MRTIANVLWVVLCGAAMALSWLFWALLLAITIIGLPFARQCVKLASFFLWPFGRTPASPSPRSASGSSALTT